MAMINTEKLAYGNAGLAKVLGVSVRTVQDWKKEGLLDYAIALEFRRTIIYDVKKAFEALSHAQCKRGR